MFDKMLNEGLMFCQMQAMTMTSFHSVHKYAHTEGSGIGDLPIHKELQGLRRPASANNKLSPLTHCAV